MLYYYTHVTLHAVCAQRRDLKARLALAANQRWLCSSGSYSSFVRYSHLHSHKSVTSTFIFEPVKPWWTPANQRLALKHDPRSPCSNSIHAADVGERNQNHQNTSIYPAGLTDTQMKAPSLKVEEALLGSFIFIFFKSPIALQVWEKQMESAQRRSEGETNPHMLFFFGFYFPFFFILTFELTQWLPSSRAFKRQGVSTETWFYTLVRFLILARCRRTLDFSFAGAVGEHFRS